MPIGTAAPSAADRARVPHHLVGFLDPHERYSAARFVADALAAIDAIHARGRRAIVVGGTGFYVRALAGDVALVARVRRRAARRGSRARRASIRPTCSPIGSPRSLRNAPRRSHRTIRIASRARSRSRSPSAAATRATRRPRRRTCATRGIPFASCTSRSRATSWSARIAARVDAMLAGGLLEEAERIGPTRSPRTRWAIAKRSRFRRAGRRAAELRAQLDSQHAPLREAPGDLVPHRAGARPDRRGRRLERAVAEAGALPGWA